MNKITATEIIKINQQVIKQIEDSFTDEDKARIKELDLINERSKSLRYVKSRMAKYLNEKRRLTDEIIKNLGLRLHQSKILADKIGYPMFKVFEFLQANQLKVIEARAKWQKDNHIIRTKLIKIEDYKERINCVAGPEEVKLQDAYDFTDAELLDGLIGRVNHMDLRRRHEFREILQATKPSVIEHVTKNLDAPDRLRKDLDFVFQPTMLNNIENNFVEAIVNLNGVPIEAVIDNFITTNQVAINEIMSKTPQLYAFNIFDPKSDWFKLRIKFLTNRLNKVKGNEQ